MARWTCAAQREATESSDSLRRAAAAASRRCRPDAERRRRDGDSGSRAGGELLKLRRPIIKLRASKPDCSVSSCDAADSVRCMAGRLVVVAAAAVVMAIGRVVYLRFLAQC